MSWLGRYATPSIIRARGSFVISSTRDLDDDTPRVVITAADDADPARSAAALDRLADAHARIGRSDGGPVPAVAERGERGGRTFVALACDAAADLETVFARIATAASRCPYRQGIAMVDRLMTALERAAAATPPACLGGIAPANLLIGRDGSLSLVGFGFNIVTTRDDATPSGAPGLACAPEVSAGGPPTPSGDVYAVVVLVRSMIGFVDFPPAALRVLTGKPLPEDKELAELLLWSNLAIVAAPAEHRPDTDRAAAATRQVWSLLGVVPDHEGYARFLAGHLDAPGGTLVVDRGAATLTLPDGTRHDLGSRRAVWRILLALVEDHVAGGDRVADVARLIAAGWPGEQPSPDSGASRVYVALSSLRKLGLDAFLERHDGGWRLARRARIVVTGQSAT